MSEKSFDINSSTAGNPVTEPLVESELAGTSEPTSKPEEPDLDNAVSVFPMSFDRDVTKDFRPQETSEVEITPKGSYAVDYAEVGQSSSPYPMGLEDVSLEDQENPAQKSAEKDSSKVNPLKN